MLLSSSTTRIRGRLVPAAGRGVWGAGPCAPRARWLSSQTERGASLAFVIGGAYGLDPEFKRKAQATMSLSPMTFPHDLVRLLFAEQLFRALSILHGHPYHKKTLTSSKR